MLRRLRRGETHHPLRDGAGAQGRPAPRYLADGLADSRRGGPDRGRLEDRPGHHGAKAAEAERVAALEREQAARLEAEQANRAKDEFLAVLSHELRTPLNAVYGWAQMLRGESMSEEQKARALETIARNANAQLQLIDDLLDVSRVASGKMRLNVRRVELQAVVEAALDAVGPAADRQGHSPAERAGPARGADHGDPDRLQQVVWNLVMNAVKFTPRGGRVQVHLQRVDSHVEIVVSDTGQGIPRGRAPVRVRPVPAGRQLEHASAQRPGAGLALVKHLVELHGGSVAPRAPAWARARRSS